MTTATTSSALYGEALHGSPVHVRHADGRCVPLAAARWLGAARGADMALLARAHGPVLDVGCGPGRLVCALAARGVPAMGVDTDREAVRLTRRAGGAALQRSVFDDLPRQGSWGTALLADGNIGIGGDPPRLLRRVAALVHPLGRVLLELAPPGGAAASAAVRLETPDGRRGEWFPWARVPSDSAEALCRKADLRLLEAWSVDESDAVGIRRRRWFAAASRG
jgi:SAM-dependent methyltransferase